jgi:ubiquinone/menaquinone biosynthesis C-methylase UbiE
MRRQLVTRAQVLEGFDALADIYAHVPPLIMWRAWEYAIYRRYRLAEPVLDIGCGDGRFFRRVFPDVGRVVGVDLSADVVDLARQSGIYERVHQVPAHQIPEGEGEFQSAFANCSLEHMSEIDAVLAEIARVTQPGASLLVSVVTNTFVSWEPLAGMLRAAGASDRASAVQRQHEAYHHLVNPLPVDDWVEKITRAGFEVSEVTPIVNGPAGWVFLLLDQLWHLPRGAGEFGEVMAPFFQRTPNYVEGTRRVFDGLLEMSEGSNEFAGIVLYATRRGAPDLTCS